MSFRDVFRGKTCITHQNQLWLKKWMIFRPNFRKFDSLHRKERFLAIFYLVGDRLMVCYTKFKEKKMYTRDEVRLWLTK